MFRTIARYEEAGLGLPYPVVLIDAAEEEIDHQTGERIGVSIPDLDGLVAALTVSRAFSPIQLHGSEVRFIRRAVGMSAKQLASALQIDPATFSRWENDKQSVGEWADKQVRMFAILLLQGHVQELGLDPKEIVGMRIRPRQDGEWPKVEMHRVHRRSDGPAETDVWDTHKLAA